MKDPSERGVFQYFSWEVDMKPKTCPTMRSAGSQANPAHGELFVGLQNRIKE
ncbi:MAG: hypothetical protein BWY26_01104 [Elusimicrobia bacterium ADurb.Bin231]|nr:MAG: hypothetical protein BWY26_01104 [Elusimicrobia bacterium ADurb.Bin231]